MGVIDELQADQRARGDTPYKPKPPSRKSHKGETVLQGNKTRDVRAAIMLTQRILGHSLKEISEQFRLSTATIKNELHYARQRDLYQIAQSIVAERLVPKALAVYDTHLEEGNLEAARDVAYGAGVLKKEGRRAGDPDPGGEVTLEYLRAKYASKPPAPQAALTIESRVVDPPASAPLKSLAARSDSPVEQGASA